MEMCWVPYAPTRIPLVDVPREAALLADGWKYEGITFWDRIPLAIFVRGGR